VARGKDNVNDDVSGHCQDAARAWWGDPFAAPEIRNAPKRRFFAVMSREGYMSKKLAIDEIFDGGRGFGKGSDEVLHRFLTASISGICRVCFRASLRSASQ
jgi:hypothetical protein